MITIQAISADEVRDYCDSGDHRLRDLHRSVLGVIDWIEEQDLQDKIFYNIGLSGFLVSDHPDFRFGEHMIRIDVTRMEDRVYFEYAKEYGTTNVERIDCDRSEVTEIFRQFLAYKFGIYRKQKVSNK